MILRFWNRWNLLNGLKHKMFKQWQRTLFHGCRRHRLLMGFSGLAFFLLSVLFSVLFSMTFSGQLVAEEKPQGVDGLDPLESPNIERLALPWQMLEFFLEADDEAIEILLDGELPFTESLEEGTL